MQILLFNDTSWNLRSANVVSWTGRLPRKWNAGVLVFCVTVKLCERA